MSQALNDAVHWADLTADKLIRANADKDLYTLASGITPSGVVHFGNFREVITVDLVARALKKRGKKVRFIFSWDDYDTFRKVPLNLPKQDELAKYLFNPIVDTPDPFGAHESYAAHHEKNFEEQIAKMGVVVEPLYQAKKYRGGEYREQIKNTLKKRDIIAGILNKWRATPLDNNWWPVSVYCEKCNRDKTAVTHYDGDSTITYVCEFDECKHHGLENLNTTTRAKLPWRMDWPMRWAFEKVDFEPGGKDHSSEGGSFTTAKEIVAQVYDWKPPMYLQYDFVSIKGMGGKMSSSKGNLVTVNDVLEVYEPEMVRWIFASYKTNTDFALSFDLDVVKNYEDFDRMERLAFGVESGNEKKVAMAKRVYELSQIGEAPTEMPFQPAFRHLCNVLQINDLDVSRARGFYNNDIKNERDERRFKERAQRAAYWIENSAPEEFKFSLNKEALKIEMNDKQTIFLSTLYTYLSNEWKSISDDKALHEKMYEMINALELEPMDVFTLLYKKLINLEKGPKLAGFIRTIGQERVLKLLVP
ncbi:MAG: lysine--tRNA ligase [Bacteriovorax sp.]|nr:lysine--tRNA ligase [Bacteriovorax sp.]